MCKEIEICGTYLRTIKKDFNNGYTFFSFSCKNYDEYKDKGKLMCGGYMPVITHGTPLKLKGYFHQSKSGMHTFDVTSCELFSDKNENTIEYLQNLQIKGIGPKIAAKIVNVTGPDIFSYIEKEGSIEELSQIPELKGEKAKKFAERIKETFFEKEIYEFVKQYGGTYLDSQSVYNAYGMEAIKKLQTNPYEVGRNTELSFIVCDAIAKEQNIFPLNENRIRYLIISALYSIANNGNTSASLFEIYKHLIYIAEQSAFPYDVPTCCVVACVLNKMSSVIKSIDEDGNTIYTLKEFSVAEDVVVENLYRLSNSKQHYNPHIASEIEKTEKKFNITYSESQKKSFEFLKTSGFKILTGGPGTGKTTVINGLIDAYKRLHPDGEISLCAPTGRAAQKIKESTGHSASTIHRFLNIKPYEKPDEAKFEVDKINSDLLIVDECSMVDLNLFAYISNAIKENTTVILCGDTFQLPSVGPGNVLHDLIDANIFEIVNLDIIYRQKENSPIIAFSQDIKQGILQNFINSFTVKKIEVDNESIQFLNIYSNKELQLIRTNSAKDINKIIIQTLKDQFLNKNSKYYVSDILNLQILSSTKKDIAGTIELNKSIHKIVQKDFDENTFYLVGDKIMMIQNNYELGYCNGDIGFITEIDTAKNTITVEINDMTIEIPHSHIKDISLSYACTIHKSQGSEYDYVIVSLPKEPISILQRNLIYTAITRAKKYVAIIYEEDALDVSIIKNNVYRRKTNLKNKLLKRFKENMIV